MFGESSKVFTRGDEFRLAVTDIGAIAIENAKLHEVLRQTLAVLKENMDGWYKFLAFGQAAKNMITPKLKGSATDYTDYHKFLN